MLNQSLRWLLVLASLVLPAAVFGAAEPNPDLQQDQPSLAGQLLIAAPDMPAERFRQTVIVMVRHGPEGALGLVINRPTGDQPLADLFAVIGEKAENLTGTVPIYSGGPVQPEVFFVLHSSEYHRPETAPLTAQLATTATPKIFHDIAAGTGPKKFIIAFGYVGWGPGQLEREMGINAWFTAPADSRLIFDEDRDKLWELAVARRTRDL